MKLLYPCQKLQGKKHPEWSYNSVIYELNVRQFSAEGTLKAAARELKRLKGMGVDIIWFMPIFPIGQERRKGTLGSYYSIRDYRAVNPEFGTMDEFKDVVAQAHKLGLKVILDWVPNHTSRDAVWTVEHPEWYEKDEATGEIATPFDWTDTAKLDYTNTKMRQAMVDAMKFWLTQTEIDGFRVDMAMLEPIDFWNWCVPQLEKARPDIFMLAEAEGTEFHERAFDATYAWDMHHLLVKIARGEANADALRERLQWESMHYPMAAFRMQFTSNHDENSWSDTEFTRMGAAAKQMAALTFILPGMPMLYNGQEVASNRKLDFFEKDLVQWNCPNDFTRLYEELCALRHSNATLHSGDRGGNLWDIDNSEPWRIFSVKRTINNHVVIAIFNFSGTSADVKFYDDDFSGEYKQIGSPLKATLHAGENFYLPPYGFFIYYK